MVTESLATPDSKAVYGYIMILNSPEGRLVSSDFLILGGGIAGLDLALRLAGNGTVVVLTKTEAGESNSQHAQGGIAAVLDPADRLEAHIEDTLTAGAGLCHADTVRFVVGNGSRSIRRLIDPDHSRPRPAS